MGELAVRTVHLAPLVKQRDDLLGLGRQQAVHRPAARRPVGQLPTLAAFGPAIDPQRGDLQHPAGIQETPALPLSVLGQIQQRVLDDRLDPDRDGTIQPQPSFPSISVSFTLSA
ncbi:hypothetical protein [Nonomuraea insulae]|uniref:Uncharacterized protein n=1 Tax=Nonomuraea insulae TaxID=1616787 RepID=A0ABW1DDY0_9ACTN